MSRKPYPTDIGDEEWSFAAVYLTLMDTCVSQRLEPVCDLAGLRKWLSEKKEVRQRHQPREICAEPLLRSVRKRTKPTTVDLYEVFCAVLYLLRTGCQWRFLPSDFPKWQTVYSYFAKWSEPDQHGVSVLEQALKKSGWRGPYETGAQRLQHALDRGRAEREEHGYGGPQRL